MPFCLYLTKEMFSQLATCELSVIPPSPAPGSLIWLPSSGRPSWISLPGFSVCSQRITYPEATNRWANEPLAEEEKKAQARIRQWTFCGQAVPCALTSPWTSHLPPSLATAHLFGLAHRGPAISGLSAGLCLGSASPSPDPACCRSRDNYLVFHLRSWTVECELFSWLHPEAMFLFRCLVTHFCKFCTYFSILTRFVWFGLFFGTCVVFLSCIITLFSS